MRRRRGKVRGMNRCLLTTGLLLLTVSALAEPAAPAVSAFNLYVAALESRLARQHRTPETFLAATCVRAPQRADRGTDGGRIAGGRAAAPLARNRVCAGRDGGGL